MSHWRRSDARPDMDRKRYHRRFGRDLFDRVALVVLDAIFKVITVGLMIAGLLYLLYVADARDQQSGRVADCIKERGELRVCP